MDPIMERRRARRHSGDRGRRAGDRRDLQVAAGRRHRRASAASRSSRARTSAPSATPACSRRTTTRWPRARGCCARTAWSRSTTIIWSARNFRMDALQAAVLRVKAPHLAGWTDGAPRATPRATASCFASAGARRPSSRCRSSRRIAGTSSISSSSATPDRDALKRISTRSGIGNEIYYPVPFHLQPCFADLGYRRGDFPHAERAARREPGDPDLRRADRRRSRRPSSTAIAAVRPAAAPERRDDPADRRRRVARRATQPAARPHHADLRRPRCSASPSATSGRRSASPIKPLADAFLRMIKMIIAPLLFSTLVVGIAGTGDLKAMGRIGLKAIIYFEVATTIALFLGLALVNIFKPGAGLAMPIGADTPAAAAMAQNQQHAWDIFLHLFPTSVVDAMARGDILQVVVFSIVLRRRARGDRRQGAAGARRPREHRAGDVQVHRLRDGVRADRRVRGDRGDRRRQGARRSCSRSASWSALMYVGLAIFALIVVGGVSLLIRVPFLDVREGDPRAVPDRVHHRQLRGGAAQGARGHGALRRAEEHRRLRAADRLQLQSRRHRRCICRWRACSSRSWPACQMTFGQQLMMMLTLMLTSKGVAGVPRAALVVLDRDADAVRPAARRRGDPARHRSDHGHGPHGGERDGQLHRHRRRRALGRRVRRRADAGVRGRRRVERPPDAHRGDRRARPARRGARPRVRRARTRSIALRPRRRSTSPTTRRLRRRWTRSRPTRSSTARRYNDVDAAEDHPLEALDVNAFARARAGARAAERTARRSCTTAPISCSTAPPRSRTPRTDPPNPQSVYAASKLLGEWFAADAPRAYVLRVESLFGQAPGGPAAEGQRRRRC